MAFYGYVRVSTETQAEKGFGLEAQRSEIEKYAASKGIVLDEIFTDAGVSASAKDTASDDEALSKRAGLLDLIGTVEKGDTIIVLHTSRLWRSDTTKVLVRRELMRRQAIVISIDQPTFDLYSTDPNDRLIAGVFELLDEWDRASIALKLARGRTTKAKGGNKPAGICPYGYMYAADKKSVIVCDEEAVIVKMMFREGQKGKSLSEIVDLLNGKGYKTRRGNPWSKPSVKLILHNRFYLGELSHQGKMIQGNHTPLISKIQFGKVAKSLERRHK